MYLKLFQKHDHDCMVLVHGAYLILSNYVKYSPKSELVLIKGTKLYDYPCLNLIHFRIVIFPGHKPC